MRVVLTLAAALILSTGTGKAAVLLTQNFNDVTSLPGWTTVNNSGPPGMTGWFQGQAGIFPAQAGAGDSYIAANYLNAAPGGNISLWLISPVLPLQNGLMIDFFSRTATNPALAPDRLSLRLSTSGSSANVGTSDTSVGDFSQLLLTINPSLSTTGYPASWSSYSTTLSGLGSPTMGRFAFWYNVPDTSVNGDYIGIDSVRVSDTSTIPEPVTLWSTAGAMLALAGIRVLRKKRNGRSA